MATARQREWKRQQLEKTCSTIKLKRPGACVPAALACLPLLDDATDKVIEGYVQFGPRGALHEHTWMVVDGQIFDPTILQFKRLRHWSAGPTRISKDVYPPSLFQAIWRVLEIEQQDRFWRERCAEFGARV